MRAMDFAETIFITDRRTKITGIQTIEIPTIRSHQEYSRFLVKSLANHISTSHVLIVQWDGYIITPSAWADEFLEYDYIGATWEFHKDDFRVGNGGFSLRSKRLLEALQDPEISEYHPEDEIICRRYRPFLEQRYGIRFAPESLARRFSFETSIPKELPFGFHALHNMGVTIQIDELPGFISQLPPSTVKSTQYLLLIKYYMEHKQYNTADMMVSHRINLFRNDSEALALKSKISILNSLCKLTKALCSLLPSKTNKTTDD
jgi:hypothetical protein